MRVRIPNFGVTYDMSIDHAARLFMLADKLDRPPIDLSTPASAAPVQQRPAGNPLAGLLHSAAQRQTAVELSNFGQQFDLANAAEQQRRAEDSVPLPRRDEDRVAHLADRLSRNTYAPRSYAMSNPGSTTGLACCGPDIEGYCMNTVHETTCGSSAASDVTEVLQSAMRQWAHQGFADADGRVWEDSQHGSPMALLDHIEHQSGVRLGDVSPYTPGNRRELVSPQRTVRFGNPDDPDDIPAGFSAATSRTAAAVAAQAGITTKDGHRAQQEAWRKEHDRQAARYRPPRHMDYRTDLSNPAPREPSGLVQVGDEPWNGSLPVYTR